MSHSNVDNRLHVVFSTKERRKLIRQEIERELWAYIVGVGRNHQLSISAVGGIEDHVHMLLELPGTVTISKAVQTIKANSSKWLNETNVKGFAWQEGYAAFSVSASNVDAVVHYIDNQREHHKKQTFEGEFLELLRKHGVDYDPKYVFGLDSICIERQHQCERFRGFLEKSSKSRNLN
jgi:putative transposase